MPRTPKATRRSPALASGSSDSVSCQFCPTTIGNPS
jgi:hypothetical protein